MDFVSFVTGPCLAEIDAELSAEEDDFGFGFCNQRSKNLCFGVGSEPDRVAHRIDKLFSAIGIGWTIVGGMGADHDSVCAGIFGKTGSGGEHDSVSKRDDCLPKVFVGIFAFGDG